MGAIGEPRRIIEIPAPDQVPVDPGPAKETPAEPAPVVEPVTPKEPV